MAPITWQAQTTLPGKDQKSEPPGYFPSGTVGPILKTPLSLCRTSMTSRFRRSSSQCSRTWSRLLRMSALASKLTWISLGVDHGGLGALIDRFEGRPLILKAITTIYKTIKRAQHESQISPYVRRPSFRSWNPPPNAAVRAWLASPSTSGPGRALPSAPWVRPWSPVPTNPK